MNVGESSNFFRESLRGFNKEDVAEYIAKLSKDYTANEEKYKEHILKLTAELKTKTDEKDAVINELREQLDLSSEEIPSGEAKEEIEKYKEAMNSLTNEIEEFKVKCEVLASEAATAKNGYPETDKETLNQLSMKLAAGESEKLYMFNLLKKFISALEIESAKGKDIGNAANISDIASKSVIAGEIETGLGVLAGYKEKAAELENENARLNEELNKKQAALSGEEQIYKEVMTKLGETVYSANKTADDTIARAQAEAGDIIEKAKNTAETIIKTADGIRAETMEEDKKKKAEIKEKYGFIKKEHEKMCQKYREASESYEFCLSEFENTIEKIYENVNGGEEEV